LKQLFRTLNLSFKSCHPNETQVRAASSNRVEEARSPSPHPNATRRLKFMKFSRLAPCAALMAALLPVASPAAEVRVGAPAPNFTANDSQGKAQTLSNFKGKWVVLEWHNNSCPYTMKHYVSGNMQGLQKNWTSKGVVWFTIISSAPGQQGYVTASQENAYMAKVHATPTAALLDPEGKVGHLYDAKTTPQMVIIDPSGKVVYDGAIDNRPTPDPSDVQGAQNYVNDALSAAMSGKPIAQSYTRPYGCSVKYSN
jgi:peroxiredoxin